MVSGGSAKDKVQHDPHPQPVAGFHQRRKLPLERQPARERIVQVRVEGFHVLNGIRTGGAAFLKGAAGTKDRKQVEKVHSHLQKQGEQSDALEKAPGLQGTGMVPGGKGPGQHRVKYAAGRLLGRHFWRIQNKSEAGSVEGAWIHRHLVRPGRVCPVRDGEIIPSGGNEVRFFSLRRGDRFIQVL